MGKASIDARSIAVTLALFFFLGSCAVDREHLFAVPAATNTSVTTSTIAGDTAAKITTVVRPALFDLIGEESDRLRSVMGGSAATTAVRKTDHFVFVSSQTTEALPEVAHLLEQTHRTFYDVFAGMKDKLSPINDPLVWMVFTGREEYERYAQNADGMDMSWAKAYYSAQTNRVAIALHMNQAQADDTVKPGAIDGKLSAQITHEAGHQLAFNSGLQKRGVMYPLWAAEGLATNFELDAQGRMGPRSANPLRLTQLLKAKAENRLMPVEAWITFAQVPVGRPAQVSAVYAQSWGFFRFLYEHHRGELQNYLAHMAAQQPGRRSQDMMRKEFIDSFGPPEKLSEAWAAYLTALQEAHGPQ